MEGERRFLDNQVSMSTIHATFYHVPVAGPGKVLDPLRDAVRDGVRMLLRSAAVAVSLIVFVTPWIVLTAAIWLLWRARRRRPVSISST
jgi:antibiotic biosynthesis monooxygenase (ABM) superfamily enzyme